MFASAAAMDFVADLINPCLILLLLLAGWARRIPRSFWVRAVISIGLVYILTHFNRWLHIWPREWLYLSGHMALGVSVAVSLAWIDRRWLLLTVPLLLLHGILMAALSYHTWLDIIGAALLSAPVAWLCHTLQRHSR